MASEHETRVEEFIHRGYHRVFILEQEGGYSALVLEFPGCFATGDTENKVWENLEEAMELWLGLELDQRHSIPEPFDHDVIFGLQKREGGEICH